MAMINKADLSLSIRTKLKVGQLFVITHHFFVFTPSISLFLFCLVAPAVYDNSRGALLRGRKTMLKLCAAQLKEQIATGLMNRKPIWVDLGGGTGNKL
jgi:hypothetical protein